MGVSPNHPCLMVISLIKQPFVGTSISGKSPNEGFENGGSSKPWLSLDENGLRWEIEHGH